MTLKITMTYGLPASGKSTWAKEQQKLDPSLKLVSKDDLRDMLDSSVYSGTNEKFVLKMRDAIITSALKEDKNIIVHDTNLNKDHFEQAIKLAERSGKNVTIEEKVFHVPVDELIERDKKRVKSVGEQVIRGMLKQYNPKHVARSVEVKENTPNKNTRKIEVVLKEDRETVVLCDLDGTIAEISHRNPYDASTADQDGVNLPVAECLRNFHEKGLKIIFLSGRQDKYEEPTRKFLSKLNIPYELFMRKSSDFRKDDIIKEELFEEHIKEKYNVMCVFDDRLSVCRLWHRLGLFLFRVGDPDASF